MTDQKEQMQGTMRSLVQDMMAKHMYEGAIFYANKLAVLSNYAPKDAFLLANAYFVDNQYHRCLFLLESRNYLDVDVRFRLLAARCLVATSSWEDCIQILGGQDALSADDLPYDCGAIEHGSKLHVKSAICAILGRSFESLENFAKSTQWYKEAVRCDPFNAEAFRLLLEGNKLVEDEEVEFVDTVVGSLPESAGWLKNLYMSMCQGRSASVANKVRTALDALDGTIQTVQNGDGRVNTPGRVTRNSPRTGKAGASGRTRRQTRFSTSKENSPSTVALEQPEELSWKLGMDSDVIGSRARLLMREGKYTEAHALTKSVIDKDSYNTNVLAAYLSIAVKLGKKNELFILGHQLMDRNPDTAEAWYAAGCYYYATKQYSSARQYFGKATMHNKLFAPAWIAFAHSFACMDETDQAMAAYRTAARLFPGLYEPHLGMSLEYSKMNNMALAEKMCKIAYSKCPRDPSVLHEMGTLAYKNGRYFEACKMLEDAIGLLDQQVTVRNAEGNDIREVCLVNLGHVYRKLQQLDKSLDVLQKAIALQPYHAGTHSAIAFVHQLSGRHDLAVVSYHKALALRPEDSFSISMLQIAVQDAEELVLQKLEQETFSPHAMET